MSLSFTYKGLPSHVVFGPGTRKDAPAVLEEIGVKNPLLISTPPQADQVRAFGADMLGGKHAGLFDNATMHTPVEVTETALAALAESKADGLVALGGGSTIGLAKALALRTDLPQLAIPSTYAGSEMTPIIGQTEGGVKTTQKTMKVLPEAVIYDPELTVTLPGFISGPSGMNAIAHSVEALYAENGNPIISMMAEDGIRALGSALPRVMADGTDMDARSEALYGAWLAGACLGSVGMAIHHKICHTLGGSFDLPHADVHCLMIAYSAAYNRDAAPEAMTRVARALGTEDGPAGLYDLMQQVATKKSLADLGMTEADLDRAADLAVKNPYYNPRPIERGAIREMLQAAHDGRQP